MLNPSTADANEDDPTIRRCIGFASSWGYGGIYVGNVFAHRATDPRELTKVVDPVGSLNDHYLRVMKDKSELVIFAWGTHKMVTEGHILNMKTLFPNAQCITISKHGKPVHPLYLNKKLTPIDFKP